MAASGSDHHAARLTDLQRGLQGAGIDAALIAPSSDLRYLTGIADGISERLTLLVVPPRGTIRMLAPAFEAPRLSERLPEVEVAPWSETDDPVRTLAALLEPFAAERIVVSDTLWARFLLALQGALPAARFGSASQLLGPMRMRKRPEEIAALRRVHAATDAAFEALVATPLAGVGERALSRRLSDLLLEAGNEQVGFATVASGPHSASPHHTLTDRAAAPGEALLFDFGGRVDGYYADVTRTVAIGRPPEGFEEVYEVVRAAQQAAVEAVRPGVSAAAIDAAARNAIEAAGYGDRFTHRVGHGLGLDVHERPYLTGANTLPLEPGMVFSVEPGIYLPGRFGVRIEDTVLVTETGGERLTGCSRELLVLS
jgi:Xaa-Pro aminopeptidase